MVKKLMALSVCAIMMMLASCGPTTTNVEQEDPNTVPETPYEINWYLMASEQKDLKMVEAAVNDYLKDKINATLKFNLLGTAQYNDRMPVMIASGDYYDLMFTAHWCVNYPSNARTNAWLALDDYLDTYLPKTAELMEGYPLESAKVDGKLYAVPTNKEFFQQRGWAYRPDIASKYDINFEEIKTFDDLLPVLKTVQENEPDFQYPIDWGSDRTPGSMYISKDVTKGFIIYYDRYPGEVVFSYETDEFKEAALAARKYYQEGLLKRDIATAQDFNARLKDGKTFAYLEFLKPGKAQEIAVDFTFPLEQVELTPPVFDNSTGSMTAVSRTSKNPIRAMRFLELLYTDPYLSNLLVYGIEGVHYNKLAENRVEPVPNPGYTMASNQWMFGSVFNNYLTKNDPADKYVKMQEYNDMAVIPDYLGFVFDNTSVISETAQLSALDSQYKTQIIMGAVDPLPIIEEAIAKFKEAGSEKVHEEAQRQYDEFLANK